MNHLNSITTRQRSSRVRDAIFAVLVATAAVLSISSVGTAMAASCNNTSHVSAHR
jgi:hypothetical protein